MNHRPLSYYHFYSRVRELSLRKSLEANESSTFNILRALHPGSVRVLSRGRVRFRDCGLAHFFLLQKTAVRLVTIGLLLCRAVLVTAES